MSVWRTQHRLWAERLKRLLDHDDQDVARLAAVGWVLLAQHRVNTRGQCRFCFRSRPAWWPVRRRTCTVYSAFMVGMDQPFHIVRRWVRDW
ncbi:MAG: hypothetical protein M3460_05410 [Actinomycetota bacterium]|nr:hypothetical protein [Actinomycetota bacterium]